MNRHFLVGVAAIALAGCHYQPTPVPVSGEQSHILALAGTWVGNYRGIESGRTGSITFTITTTADSAFGDVLMEAAPGVTMVQPADDPRVHQLHARSSRLLAIRFVDIYGGSVEGAMEPYIAPDCECEVYTRFTGRVEGNTIRGTFFTHGRLISPQTGEWSVTRSK